MAIVKLEISEHFIRDVAELMAKAKPAISQNELARELDMDPSQVSRWFTTNPTRQVTPSMATAVKIQGALKALLFRRRYR